MVLAYTQPSFLNTATSLQGLKSMTNKFLLAASTIVAITGFHIATASANLIYTNSIASQSSTNYASGLAVTLPKFDTTLGTLNSIIFTVSTSELANVAVSNASPTTDYAFTNGNAALTLFTTGPGGFFNSLLTSATVANGTALQNSVTFFSGLTGISSAATNIGSSNFASYEGVGLANLIFDALVVGTNFSGNSAAPSNTLFFGGGANLGVDVSIEYDFTVAAPEPASVALIGTAMAGLGVARRRRRAN
jgi:hypothetical protein